MIEDKVLVFCDYPINENEGGPIGYYNKCLYKNTPDNIILLKSVFTAKKQFSIIEKIRNKFRNRFKKNDLVNSTLHTKFISLQCKEFKFFYFHSVYDLYDVLHLINEDQIVILQSHSPELPSAERFKNGANDYLLVRKIEKISFKRANYLVFPNEDSMVIYNSVISDKHKIKFLTTGIKPIESKVVLPLDNQKINILYIGRKNEIKGFYFLIESFKKASAFRDDIRLIIAGNGEKIIGKDIYDIGITDRPFDWINSVDFVISLNKESYFDLNVIESICLGTPLIMTTSEGHTFFKNRRGIISVDYDNIIGVLMNKNLVNKNYKIENRAFLKQFYHEFLSDIVFKNNLNKMCTTILNNEVNHL
ncbi:Glycosyltransferase involved in cell wall bisynthesis [Flavobacterium micromati]|uniref:Glycosyltransferase involved in cell wall bisynthesis n=1 Tax=Flavobacterium micromati TaxID=229205 RepID=A0A1M5H741_9FLAO|nr:glycosyltransferase [Flavobacterium micromati]SHG11754.1 Glycosyltransferase involved in cell wall bisynthesis [Flavobacterium micromati]